VYLDPALAGKVVGGFVHQVTPDSLAKAGALSERETEVGRLTAAGHSNKEIATQVDLSVKTVETYRARGMEKLGLQSRADLVRYAVQQGWLKDC
jgi:DNA-binding NarL/FixJ family response regulator